MFVENAWVEGWFFVYDGYSPAALSGGGDGVSRTSTWAEVNGGVVGGRVVEDVWFDFVGDEFGLLEF